MSYTSLDQLRADRRGYVESARRNKFEDGLRTLLADLYPDNAHFIFELLQNAEDAQATTVDFTLERDRLIVSHNGTRPFTLEDIESITGIGQSPKKDDETQIGKFGVGFKAVFAYTNRPEVHSGEHAFVIEDLFVPEVVKAAPPGENTVFVFPFDRPEKPPSVAYEEVARGLQELGSSTVLFLTRISTIGYKLADGGSGRVERADEEYPRITITQTADGVVERTSWLRVVGRPRDVSGNLLVAAAFRLHDPGNKTEKSKSPTRLRVQPLEGGETCIYFPAAKETSGLRFHIHAPFASTVARDSLRNTPENAALVEAIGQLVADVLPKLREDGLLDDGLLSALPNVDDPLESPYDTIRARIYEAFQRQPLTPVFGGGDFVPANDLVRSPAELRRGLEQTDLPTMLSLSGSTYEADPKWVASRDGRAGQFLRGLEIAEFGWSGLRAVLHKIWLETISCPAGDSDALSTWRAWLASRSDERLKIFYELLGYGVLEGQSLTFKLPLIRVIDGTTVTHVLGRGLYLPLDRDDTGSDRVASNLVDFVDDEEAPSKSRNALEAFYRQAGVRRWDERAIVEQRLKAYVDDKPDWKEHLGDLRMFMQFAKSHPLDPMLRAGVILWGENAEGATYWVNPNNLVIDEPYVSSGLATLYENKYRLAARYKGQVSGIAEFAEALGAVTELSLQAIEPWENQEFNWRWRSQGRMTDNGSRRDWVLPTLDKLVATQDPVLLRSLWELACRENQSKARAHFQLNGSAARNWFSSRIAQRLRTTAWILDQHGELRTPQSMTLEDLPDGWSEPDSDSLAMAVGFGEDAKTRDLKQVERRKQAEALGINLEMVEEFAEFDEQDQLEMRELMRQRKESRAFPSAASADPERRAAIAGVDALDAPEYQSDVRERRVATGASAETREAARQYLRENYIDEGVMTCQACHQPMPFKVSDKWYFEAVQFLRGRKRFHRQNYLALCPLCAAKYAHVRGTSDEALVANLEGLTVSSDSGTVALPILLNGGRVELKFTGKHAIDLKAVIAAAGETRAES